jgi:hypothetical protein
VPRLITWLRGPELYWLGCYGATMLVARFNVPPTEAGNAWMESIGMWLLPLASVPLSFRVTFGRVGPSQSRRLLWARLAFATFIGLNACLFYLVDAIDYGDSRNSGVLGVWMMGLMVGSLLFAAGSMMLAWRAARA